MVNGINNAHIRNLLEQTIICPLQGRDGEVVPSNRRGRPLRYVIRPLWGLILPNSHN